ncbi:hypothetical protein PPL_09539 [Heterostelium album PN500]|uniref:Copper transport protein n=1 Tax=Heterostelium pallidum (strain ATCC 26659 / Pp 5 / PN500) TaxID=670386 RepID=D3BNC8_HETP5|nr:hypothetical protein PPL_09539 [Heterostelium album PN500]EFA76788.1 hypothetical protein PPL_09539 [Heterostelium album PN500]|eukprot:XP_020428920.1 hypothetical protein PPL_09539 [Heterostelium album PN500]
MLVLKLNVINHLSGTTMYSFFHWDFLGQAILFKGWVTNNVGIYVLTLFVMFGMAVFSEFFTSYRHSLNYNATDNPETTPLINDTEEVSKKTSDLRKNWNKFSATHYWKTFCHIVQYVVNYFIMLVVMTFNAGLALAILGGIATGYFIFGKKRVADNIAEEELCH